MARPERKPRAVPPPAQAADAAKSYARFIPREEMPAFAAWKIGDLGAPPAPSPLRRATDADNLGHSDASPSERLAAQLRAARQSGYQDGYRDGLVALDGFKSSFAAQTTAQVHALVQSLDRGLGALQQQMSETLALAATQIARQVVRADLGARPEIVSRVAEEAVEALLLSARHVTVRVHPDDQALIAAGAAETLAARAARFVADPAIARGGCLVESDLGVVDATLETRWRNAVASLGVAREWTPADGAAAADARSGVGADADADAEARR